MFGKDSANTYLFSVREISHNKRICIILYNFTGRFRLNWTAHDKGLDSFNISLFQLGKTIDNFSLLHLEVRCGWFNCADILHFSDVISKVFPNCSSCLAACFFQSNLSLVLPHFVIPPHCSYPLHLVVILFQYMPNIFTMLLQLRVIDYFNIVFPISVYYLHFIILHFIVSKPHFSLLERAVSSARS